jgi:hypothetical protein
VLSGHQGQRTSIIMMSDPLSTFSPYQVASTALGVSKASAASGISNLRKAVAIVCLLTFNAAIRLGLPSQFREFSTFPSPYRGPPYDT